MSHTRRCLQLSSILSVTVALAACKSTTASSAPPPSPPQVSVETVQPERVALTSEWIATLDGYVNAQIRPQVSGYLLARNFGEGAVVRKGQVLFEIDPRPLESVLAQARARLGEAQAQLGKTERDLQRDQPLAEQRAIAQGQLDNDVQANLAAQAAVRSAAAAVETAQLNVAFTKVTSLIDGVAAIATAQIGDLVGPATLLTTVSQIDPIKAYFPLSEQEYLQVADRINTRGTAKSPVAGRRRPHAGPRRRQRVPATRRLPRRRSRDRREDRDDPHQRHVPEPRPQAAAGPVRPRARRNERAHRRAARAAARRQRAAGLVSWCASSERTTRWARAPSRSASASAAAGSSRKVSNRARASSSKAPPAPDGTLVSAKPFAAPAEGH